MSVTAIPVTFEGQHIAPSDDGAAWASCMTDGISSGCEITKSGNTITVGAGKIVACGRTVRVPSQGTLSMSSSATYARVILTIDMTQSGDDRAAITIQTRTAASLWTSLTKDDVNNGGTKYIMVLCAIEKDAGIIWKCGRARSRGFGTQVTLPAAGWSNNRQTVYVDGVLADSNVIVSYDPASQAAWEAANISAVDQANGTITFKCDTVPSSAITANILLY
jgi:hypothetical protein